MNRQKVSHLTSSGVHSHAAPVELRELPNPSGPVGFAKTQLARVSTAAERWREARGNYASGHWNRTRIGLLRHVIDAVGDVRLVKLNREHLWKIQAHGQEIELAPSTINKITHHTLAAACRDLGIDRRDLFRSVRQIPDPAPSNVAPWSREERDRILEATWKLDACYRPFMVSLFYTGARPGELLGLTWTDVDLENRWARIARSRRGDALSACKTRRSRREIPLATPVVEEIGSIPEERSHPYVFQGPAGGPLDLDNFRKRAFNKLWKLEELADVPRRPLYCARHTFITLAIQSGRLTVPQIAGIVGDRVRTIEERYYRWIGEPCLDELDLALAPAAAKVRRIRRA